MAVDSDKVEAAHTGKERRHDQRVLVPLSMRVSISRDGHMVRETTKTVNVSAGGAYFGSDVDFNVGENVLVSIGVPPAVYIASPLAEFSGPATVVRVNRESPPEGKGTGVAIRFNSKLIFCFPGVWQSLASTPSV